MLDICALLDSVYMLPGIVQPNHLLRRQIDEVTLRQFDWLMLERFGNNFFKSPAVDHLRIFSHKLVEGAYEFGRRPVRQYAEEGAGYGSVGGAFPEAQKSDRRQITKILFRLN